jgi:hypothetical protein
MRRIAAYAWEKIASKQVVFMAPDGHIHELFVLFGGTWQHADLTQLTGAPPPASDSAFAGYEWTAGGSKQVAFVTESGHFHELFVSTGTNWNHADLSDLAGAPPPFDEVDFSGYEWQEGQSKQLVYPGGGGRIHELFVSGVQPWSHVDLTGLTSAALASANFPNVSSYEWQAGGTKQVTYRAEDGDIHELFVSAGGSWAHADPTQLAGAPRPDIASALLGFQWQQGRSKQIMYITTDGHIHEISVLAGGTWQHADLSDLTSAPRAEPDTALTAYEWEAGGTKQVAYRTEDGHIHELFVSVGGTWAHADLTQLAGAPPADTNAPSLAGYQWKTQGSKQVAYLTSDGHIHELFVSTGGTWQHADLTQLASAPPAT